MALWSRNRESGFPECEQDYEQEMFSRQDFAYRRAVRRHQEPLHPLDQGRPEIRKPLPASCIFIPALHLIRS
jgi:hypothetical protein